MNMKFLLDRAKEPSTAAGLAALSTMYSGEFNTDLLTLLLVGFSVLMSESKKNPN